MKSSLSSADSIGSSVLDCLGTAPHRFARMVSLPLHAVNTAEEAIGKALFRSGIAEACNAAFDCRSHDAGAGLPAARRRKNGRSFRHRRIMRCGITGNAFGLVGGSQARGSDADWSLLHRSGIRRWRISSPECSPAQNMKPRAVTTKSTPMAQGPGDLVRGNQSWRRRPSERVRSVRAGRAPRPTIGMASVIGMPVTSASAAGAAPVPPSPPSMAM